MHQVHLFMGGNTKIPFSIIDKIDNPISLYAATKNQMN